MQAFNTLTEALDTAAETNRAIGFIDGARDERRLTYKLLRRAALRLLATLQADGAQPGEPLVLFIDDNLHFVQFFWAALYGGLIPVPVAAGANEAHLDKLLRIWSQTGEPRLVTSAHLMERLQTHLEASDQAATGQRLAAQCMADEPATVATDPTLAQPAPEDTAFIQFSSGSTGDPKGVVLTHANLLANIRAIIDGSQLSSDEIALSWMPLTHDMGLIGFHLTPVCKAMEHHLMSTDVFARRPLLWLEKAHDKKAAQLCSPNFGYRHTLRAIQARGLPDLDLSHVRLIYNGAEPIAAPLVREFFDTLAPTGLKSQTMFCVYGLAEASLAATFPPAGSGMTTLSVARGQLGLGDTIQPDDTEYGVALVNLGQPVTDADLRIVDARDRTLPADTVGHVWIKGPNVTAGYYRHDTANAQVLKGDGWLDTGDLGFIHGDDLYITGRARDVIFINGANHYPQDIEAFAQRADQVGLNKVAATGIRTPGADADALVLFVLFRGHLEDFVPIARDVAQQINQGMGLVADHVLPVTQLPKTTSGKLQRSALIADYEQGAFSDVQAQLNASLAETRDTGDETAADDTAIASQLKAICDEVAADKTIGYDDNLFEIGLSSLELAQIHEGIEERWPARIEINDLFEYPTINELAAFLA